LIVNFLSQVFMGEIGRICTEWEGARVSDHGQGLTCLLKGQEGIPPRMFKSLIGTGHPEFASSRQQVQILCLCFARCIYQCLPGPVQLVWGIIILGKFPLGEEVTGLMPCWFLAMPSKAGLGSIA
jgi:hypothetical protein